MTQSLVLSERPIRVLMAKVGLDGHDRGAKVVMTALRDAGMEVIYSGLHQSPHAVVRAAVEEDVDVIGLSILSGAHNDLVPKVVSEMKAQGIGERSLVLGGIIPESDISKLKKMGVFEVFTPGATLDSIIEKVHAAAKSARSGKKNKKSSKKKTQGPSKVKTVKGAKKK
jgi:methylmalonyl-CoA mutase C-terminal domain/subunit